MDKLKVNLLLNGKELAKHLDETFKGVRKVKKLKKLKLNVKKGTLKVNGQDLSDVSCFNIHFENGLFTLTLENKYYSSGKIKETNSRG